MPYVVDWNAYRGVFEEEASRVLGRDVRVGGKVNLRLLPAPYVRFEKVRVSDTDAVLGEPFFRAESFTLWLSAMPLLRGAIEANEIELDRPVLRLSIDAAGNGNWQSLPRAGGVSPLHAERRRSAADQGAQRHRVAAVSRSRRTLRADRHRWRSVGDVVGRAIPFSRTGGVEHHRAPSFAWPSHRPETDGRLRFRAVVRVPESNNSYTFDGGLSEVTTRAKLDGTLTARLPIAAIATPGTIAGKGKDAAKPKSASEQNAFDLKAACDRQSRQRAVVRHRARIRAGRQAPIGNRRSQRQLEGGTTLRGAAGVALARPRPDFGPGRAAPIGSDARVDRPHRRDPAGRRHDVPRRSMSSRSTWVAKR